MSVVDRCRIGERIPIASGADMSTLGTAIHACLALSFTDPGVPLTGDEVFQVLEGFGVSEHVAVADVLRQITALHAWIHRRWPGVRAHAEFPVQSVMSNGQILNGRIDLLLETSTGWVLIDHKASPLPAERWEALAAEHGPQLSSYALALERATSRAVQESWLFLPVAGGGVALGFG